MMYLHTWFSLRRTFAPMNIKRPKASTLPLSWISVQNLIQIQNIVYLDIQLQWWSTAWRSRPLTDGLLFESGKRSSCHFAKLIQSVSVSLLGERRIRMYLL